MGEWRGLLAFVVVLLVMLAAASWLIRETPDLLVGSPESPGDAPDQAAPSEPTGGASPSEATDPTDPANPDGATDPIDPANPDGATDPIDPAVPSPDEAVDAAAIEAAIELASQQQQPAEPISLQEACEGLGGAWA